MMEADYRRKTSEVARIREEQQAKLNDLEAKILDASSMLQSELEDLNSAEMQDLKELDPQAFYEKKEKIESKALKLKQLQEHSQRAQLEARQAEVEKQKELLFQQLPEWLDQDTLKRESVMVNKLWDDYGFSPEELNSFTDHRMVLISLDAAKFREAKNAKPANKKIQPKPKSATPSTSTTKEQRQAKKANEIRSKVKKTGKMHDAGRAIADLLR